MTSKRILIFTDAWEPQVNGVVVTLKNTIKECEKRGFSVTVISPESIKYRFPLPTYPEIKIAMTSNREIRNTIKRVQPDYIHIATEGPIGFKAAAICKKLTLSYTSSYHTKFPEYINNIIPLITLDIVYNIIKKIHDGATKTLVTTESMKEELTKHGFNYDKLVVWNRGVDNTIFNFKNKERAEKIVLLNVGRVSVEKNLKAFLDLTYSYPDKIIEKRIVGKGPLLKKLQKEYAHDDNIIFVGEKKGLELATEYQNADVFVFPSLTDTFGLVQIESMVCGTPVAAFNVTGPKDVITNGVNGYVGDDLGHSIDECLTIDRLKCYQASTHLTWESVSDTFINTLTPTGEVNNESKRS